MKFDSRYQEDNYYMKKALELAKLGIGAVNPNPLVGCIIVKDGKVIGEGYHMKFGEPHAEVNAINSAKEDIEGATVYVTLEPCSHFGKTPPCADNLVRHKVKRVVICNNDPNPLVAGNGIKKLQNAGIEYRKFHITRHTYASRLIEKNVNLKVVQTLLGHSSLKMTSEIYAHVLPKQKIDAVELLNDCI